MRALAILKVIKILEGVLWLKIKKKKTTKLSATNLWPLTNDKKRECKNIYMLSPERYS